MGWHPYFVYFFKKAFSSIKAIWIILSLSSVQYINEVKGSFGAFPVGTKWEFARRAVVDWMEQEQPSSVRVYFNFIFWNVFSCLATLASQASPGARSRWCFCFIKAKNILRPKAVAVRTCRYTTTEGDILIYLIVNIIELGLSVDSQVYEGRGVSFL